MSRSYSIRLPLNIILSAENLKKFGTFSMVFPLLEIVKREKMLEILREKLLEKGFSEDGELLKIDLDNGSRGVFNPETMTLNIHLPVEEEISIRVKEEVLDKVKAQIQRAMETGELLEKYKDSVAMRDVADEQKNKIVALATELRKEINAALKETYKDAIKEKASQLGSVTNLSESSANGVYKIRLEIEA